MERKQTVDEILDEIVANRLKVKNLLADIESRQPEYKKPEPVKTWFGIRPKHCDMCEKHIDTVFVDGKTRHGPWGCLCEACHVKFGIGLGVGKGQKYELTDSKWVKTEG